MNIINKSLVFGIFLSVMFVFALALPNVAQAQYYGCGPHTSQRCSGTSLYWYDSCGNQQELIQYCQDGCSNNACQTNYNNYNNYSNYNIYGNCTYHAYRLCVGNNIYWYSGCQVQQDLFTSCYNGQTCQYLPGSGATCSNYIAPIINPVLPPVNPYIAYYRTACYDNSIYWYDSLGAISGLNKSCADGNACTADSCSANACIHTQIENCPTNPTPTPAPTNCGNGLCEPALGETTLTCSADCKISAPVGYSVSFFTKKDAGSNQWQKTTQANSNGQIYFMVSVANSSTSQIDSLSVSANIPGEISSLGNLQINGVAVAGDIVAGVNIGSVAPLSTKSITFEGKTQAITSASTKTATATTTVSGVTQSDTVSIEFTLAEASAAVSGTPAASGFGAFLKRWYLWILGGFVLIFLFVVVFKRFSSEA